MTGRVAEGGGIGDGWAAALGIEGAGGRALAEPGCCGTGEASVADKGGRWDPDGGVGKSPTSTREACDEMGA